jgi:AbiV family abortive infection protein
VAKKRSSGEHPPEPHAGAAEASLGNAAELIAEARALLEAGSHARAYSLAIVAGEEFGKCQLAIGSVGRGHETDDYWKEWWGVFYGHGPKLARAASIAARFLPVDLVEAFTRILEPALKDQRREIGFYVDVSAGDPVLPTTAIQDDEARDAIEVFGSVIDQYVGLFEGSGLAQAFIQANSGPAMEMRAALDSGDRETIRSAWEATTGRRPSDAELEGIMSMLSDE